MLGAWHPGESLAVFTAWRLEVNKLVSLLVLLLLLCSESSRRRVNDLLASVGSTSGVLSPIPSVCGQSSELVAVRVTRSRKGDS